MKFYENTKFSTPEKQKVALVDIDETICYYPNQRRYDLAQPIQENINKINKLYDEGWKIIYWTARGTVSGADYKDFTLTQLNQWDCKFHELKCGRGEKPHFDLVIDDKSKRIEEL
jgi:CMP-N,N'-diacetyllegionaminic acid synthase